MAKEIKRHMERGALYMVEGKQKWELYTTSRLIIPVESLCKGDVFVVLDEIVPVRDGETYYAQKILCSQGVQWLAILYTDNWWCYLKKIAA